MTDWITACGAGPWLWFIAAYTAIVGLQRWHIDREFIARYWLPYWIVAVLVVGWCALEWARRPQQAWRRAVSGTAAAVLLLTAYNAAQIAVTAASNARAGVTLNALRYQESELLAALADGEVDVVYADDFELVAFQSYAKGKLVRVERLSCDVEGVDELAAELRSAMDRGARPAVAVIDRCRRGDLADELAARFADATVLRDPDLGVVVLPAG